MGVSIILTGMVLNAMPVGEYDRRITVLTKERGKITAFARGARRYGFYFLEVADYFSHENNDGREVLKLLYQTLRALKSDAFDNRLVRRVFELRTLLAEGVYPNVFSCQGCGKKEGLIRFSVRQGGMLCNHCAADEGSIAVGADTLYTLQYVLAVEIGKLYTFRVSKHVLAEFGRVVERAFTQQVCHTFRSLEILQGVAAGGIIL